MVHPGKRRTAKFVRYLWLILLTYFGVWAAVIMVGSFYKLGRAVYEHWFSDYLNHPGGILIGLVGCAMWIVLTFVMNELSKLHRQVAHVLSFVLIASTLEFLITYPHADSDFEFYVIWLVHMVLLWGLVWIAILKRHLEAQLAERPTVNSTQPAAPPQP